MMPRIFCSLIDNVLQGGQKKLLASSSATIHAAGRNHEFLECPEAILVPVLQILSQTPTRFPPTILLHVPLTTGILRLSRLVRGSIELTGFYGAQRSKNPV